jgi:hypothetical protein
VGVARSESKGLMAYFNPFNADTDKRNCWTCTHSMRRGEHHVFCRATNMVTVFPCGRWERGAGCDEPERTVKQHLPGTVNTA